MRSISRCRSIPGAMICASANWLMRSEHCAMCSAIGSIATCGAAGVLPRPNLEQCGLLQIVYRSLDEVCAAEDLWQACHPALVTANSTTRQQIAKVLLDYIGANWRSAWIISLHAIRRPSSSRAASIFVIPGRWMTKRRLTTRRCSTPDQPPNHRGRTMAAMCISRPMAASGNICAAHPPSRLYRTSHQPR